MFDRDEYSRAGLHLFKSVLQWVQQIALSGATHLEIESVREIHIIGSIDPSMNLRTERGCNCQKLIKL